MEKLQVPYGWKEYSDSYLEKMSKREIIEILRCAEHNYYATNQDKEWLFKLFKEFSDGLIEDNVINIEETNRRLYEAQNKIKGEYHV